MSEMGLYLNDLNFHGLSREMVFSGFKHYSRLDLMCEREEQRAEELETSLNLADMWKKQGEHKKLIFYLRLHLSSIFL